MSAPSGTLKPLLLPGGLRGQSFLSVAARVGEQCQLALLPPARAAHGAAAELLPRMAVTPCGGRRRDTLLLLFVRSVRSGGAVEAALAARALALLAITLGAGDDSERCARCVLTNSVQTSDMILQHHHQICSTDSAAWRRRPRAPAMSAQDNRGQ